MSRLFIALLLAATAHSADPVSANRIRANTKFLSSDLLEGRGVGTRGDKLTTEYLATQLALAGAKPAGDNGTFFQKVPLIGVTTEPSASLSAVSAEQTIQFRWLQDFIGASHRQGNLTEFQAEAVFVGHGIVAPEQGWDDYKGTDVRGKIVVLFTNEPQSGDPALFGGRALTYYGRWTYKYEEALRQGALGAIIIHTDATAGYGWEVVRNSWAREDPQVELKPGQTALGFAGWLTRQAGERLVGLARLKIDELLALSDSRDFRPIALGVRIKGRIPAKIRPVETRNVAALIPGSDPALRDQAVLFSAHWDHLGIGEPVDGDAIYNGAVDNATGCAIVLELARAWASLPEKPRRSALFLFVTAEESGLRGSEYYSKHPLVAPGNTAVALNFDAFRPFGRTRDIVVSGAERTTLWPAVQEAAARMNFEIKPDPRPEQGLYYRSDHFSFARVGIPAFSVSLGSEYLGKPAGYGEQLFREFNTKSYHQPSDEFDENWDFSGLEAVARFGFLLGINAANEPSLPAWNEGDEFQKAREAK
ncbi:MAG: M28 family peptidase [Bryobacteraceae bacterium]|nr:M28 family peptidase [Bryobacterales bacterium]MEB2362873.1 M28 family peptidase [Bryobacterales bacterium]NUN00914.1 M28 family peptidase [Bryobacteraceae bacterium]